MLSKALILTHRYVGIPMSVVFVVWFLSGIVMIYTGGMPSLSADERAAGRAALDLSAVDVSPGTAREQAGFSPRAMRLLTITGRPAYRLETARGSTTVFADTGERLGEVGPDQARSIASRFTGLARERIGYERMVAAPDQWTLTLTDALPLIKLRADDAAGTEIYVSVYEAEVALVTDRLDRALAWAGAIPHWFYVTPLRTNQPAWFWTVVVAAGIGTCLALIGLVLGVTQLRRPRPFRLRAAFGYSGWMHWHHVLGLVFGLFALTWVFSGLLSMQPLNWTRMEGAALQRGALGPGGLEPAKFAALGPADAARMTDGGVLTEIELLEILGDPYYLAHGGPGTEPVLLDAATLAPRTRAFSTDALVARLEAAAPDAPVLERRLLSDYDAYYYARGGEAPLPVLRVKLGDPAATWAYIDPERGRLVRRYNRRERIERWLYYGLHSLDFAFWYDRRPLWDLGMIALSLGGLATSGLGLYLGYRRMRRFVLRLLTGRGSHARAA